MLLHRQYEARHRQAILRWEHENDLERPYRTIPLTTRMQGTAFVRRRSEREVLIVTPQSVRVMRWPLMGGRVRPRTREFRARGSRLEPCCTWRGVFRVASFAWIARGRLAAFSSREPSSGHQGGFGAWNPRHPCISGRIRRVTVEE